MLFFQTFFLFLELLFWKVGCDASCVYYNDEHGSVSKCIILGTHLLKIWHYLNKSSLEETTLLGARSSLQEMGYNMDDAIMQTMLFSQIVSTNTFCQIIKKKRAYY